MIIRTPGVADETVVERTEVANAAEFGLASRLTSLVYVVLSIVSAIICFRFVLLIVGVNRNNEFADLIMRISQPLVGPFLSLVGESPSVGQGYIEWTDLVAWAVYSIAAAIVIKLIHTLLAPRQTVVYR